MVSTIDIGVFHIVACYLLGFLYGFLEEIIIGSSGSLHLYVCYQTWFAILWYSFCDVGYESLYSLLVLATILCIGIVGILYTFS